MTSLGDELYYKFIGLKDGIIRTDFVNGLFRFTQPNELNDPHEVYPEILINTHSDEDIDEARQLALKEGFPRDDLDRFLPLFLNTSPRGRMTPEEFPALAYPPGISSMDELDADNARKELDDLLTHINSTYGIFCLARSRDSLLMWSHYAESHRGIFEEANRLMDIDPEQLAHSK
jgi:hypothetical protein